MKAGDTTKEGMLIQMIVAVKDFAGRHFCTIIAILLCIVLVAAVPQLGYAFFKLGYGYSGPAVAVIPLLFLTYFVVSVLAVFGSSELFRRKSLHKMSPSADERDTLRRRYLPLVTVSSWPVSVARRMTSPWLRCVVAVLVLVGGLTLILAYFLRDHVTDWYPLSDLALVNLGWMAVLFGSWLLLISPERWKSPGEMPAVSQALGWRVGWLCSTCLLGEVIWLVASQRWTPSLGYLMYTQWGVLQVLAVCVIGRIPSIISIKKHVLLHDSSAPLWYWHICCTICCRGLFRQTSRARPLRRRMSLREKFKEANPDGSDT